MANQERIISAVLTTGDYIACNIILCLKKPNNPKTNKKTKMG